MGKIKYTPPDTTKTKCIKDTTKNSVKGNIKVVPEKHIKGEVEATPPVAPRTHPPKKKSPKPPPPPLMGDVMIDESKH